MPHQGTSARAWAVEGGAQEPGRRVLHGARTDRLPLWAIETAELCRCADKLSIDVKAKWDEDGVAAGYTFFSREDRNALKRAIKVQRRETAKFWATVLVSVLSLLVALAAVLLR